MKTAKFLFWIGVAVIVVQLIGNIMVFARMAFIPSTVMPDWGTVLSGIASCFVGGGTLIGISKIIEKLYAHK